MIKRTTSFKEPKVDKGGFTVKDQGRVKYASIESVEASASPKPGMGKGKSRGGGDAQRGTNFEGVF
jgi:hypothetical protein